MVSLNNLFEETIFFIGAGASKELGCKLSREMLDDLKEQIKLHHARNPSCVYQEIYPFILACLRYQYSLASEHSLDVLQDVNIEDFVMVLKQIMDKEVIIPPPLVGNWSDRITRWELSNQDVFKEFYHFIVNNLVSRWTNVNHEDEEFTTYMKPFKELVATGESFTLKLFSLNYDLAFESLNSESETIVNTGFSIQGGSEQGERISVWADTFGEPMSPAMINLYKLHGSLTWSYEEELEAVVEKDSIIENPFIIFGTANKMNAFDPFLCMLSHFRASLQKAKILIVVGYSFFDKYLNNMLIQHLMSDPEKRVVIIDPCRDSDSEAFCKELENIQQSKLASEFINLKKLNHEKVKVINCGAKDFFTTYLGDRAKRLSEIYTEMTNPEKAFD